MWFISCTTSKITLKKKKSACSLLYFKQNRSKFMYTKTRHAGTPEHPLKRLELGLEVDG